MKCLKLKDVRFPETIQSPYMACKYLERNGIPLDNVNLGNYHKIIEEAVDNNQLPVTQVINEENIEGYLIGV